MENKNIIQKASTKIRFNKLLKKKVRTITVEKSLYDSLTMLTPFRNSVNLTLKECKFNILPKKSNTLHYPEEITLFKEYVVNNQSAIWEWLEQGSIRSNFQFLKIKNNDLPKLPLQMTCLKNFTTLNLSGNEIDSLPKQFGLLPLLTLNLSYNKLGRSEESAWEWLMQTPIRNNLKALDITHNYLSAIPLQISYTKNLQILHLGENDIYFLQKEFGALSQLTILNLSDNLLGTCKNSTWEWLNAPIKDKLLELDISCNLLTEFPLQITCMKNLRSLDISENEINFLPKELGTLPHLTILNLTSNNLGEFDGNTWEWLDQTAIRNKLSELYLCDNLLMALPPQIGKLNALNILELVGNDLKCLPQSLVNLKNLQELNLCENDLLYLPGTIAHLSVNIDVSGNPFNLEDDDNLSINWEVPSLMECSAQVIMKFRLNSNVLPPALVRYFNEKKYCFFCKTPCFFYYKKHFIKYFEYDEILNIKMIETTTSNITNASFECYACSPECAKKLRNAN